MLLQKSLTEQFYCKIKSNRHTLIAKTTGHKPFLIEQYYWQLT